MKLATLTLGCLALAAAPALADICAYNDRNITQKALAHLTVGTTAQKFCKPCNEKKAQKIVIQKVETAPKSGGDFEVMLNGRGVDLGYLFVQKPGNDTWQNVGKLTECSNDPDIDAPLPAALVDK